MNWQGNYMTYGGFQTGPPGFVEPAPKMPLRVKLTPRERGSYNLLLSQADPDGHNRVEGAQAVEFLKRSGLSTDVLKNIWVICTPEGEGYLDRERFYVALRLIALAQEGKPASEQSIFDDVPAGIPKFQSNVVVKDKWDLESTDKEKYSKAFLQISSGKGYLTSEETLEVFRKTQVRPEYLKKIWNLSDPNDSGEFRENQFMVAMHLITRVKNLSEPVPDELPASLKKIMTPSIVENKIVSQAEPFADFGNPAKNPNDAFSDFGLSAISSKPIDSYPSLPTTDIGFGVNLSSNFQTMPIKNNLEAPMSSISGRNSMNSMNSMNSKIEKTEEKGDMIGFDIKAKEKVVENESPNKPIGRMSSRKSTEPNVEEKRKEEEISEQLERVEEKIQKRFRELRDVRAKLSLEREKNQMLSMKLSEGKSKQLSDLSQLILNILDKE